MNKYLATDKFAVPENWFVAFAQLEELVANAQSPKKVLFLDELPWLDTPHSGFIQALDYFWNSFASARKDVILLVCGSAASWMINKLIHNKGGLHNRVTYLMRLDPFTLEECETFFNHRKSIFTRYQLIQLYMVMGGIPFYLDRIDPGSSAAQNINRLCFQPDGPLADEFNELYTSLFKKAEVHLAIVEALSKKAKGLTRNQLITKARLSKAGSTTRVLKELEESGFIRKYLSFGKKERNALYQLSDFYSLFYIKFIGEIILSTKIAGSMAWTRRNNEPGADMLSNRSVWRIYPGSKRHWALVAFRPKALLGSIPAKAISDK